MYCFFLLFYFEEFFLGFKKVIADTKYKLVYSNDSDPKCGISQSDLYQMVSYAIRFSINEVKLLYPANIANTFLGDFNIKIKDTLADGKEIEISAHQLPIIDMNLTSAEIKTHQSFINSFEKLKSSPLSLMRIKYLTDLEDYIIKKEFTSELDNKVYQPENYFIKNISCIEN